MAKPRHPTLVKYPTLGNIPTPNATQLKAKPAPVITNTNIVGWRLWLIQPTLIIKDVGWLSGEAAPPDIGGNTRHWGNTRHQATPTSKSSKKAHTL
ncbi:hypothetical protein A2I96_16100 [Pseudoalteromonas tetraodonis]|uniref:Uncharacterized protein n=1 Tax=Pseudoalteromonas tetraodonis TaxID=43659 RepID=A0ABD4EL58_9GAMM|nr:hypothetical protein [Pseudoalteromonas spiralis]KYL33934.1 hypothetical protein A2I96_16100 [Pseudoalteromonas spiralis]